MEVLFILLAERYERGSVLVTSNLVFPQWCHQACQISGEYGQRYDWYLYEG
jgi:hypothetical protein